MKKSQKTNERQKSNDAKLLTDHIADRVLRLADAVILLSARSIKERWGLRHTDLRLLNILDGEDALSVREISRRAHVDQAWVSRSLRKLEGQRFVQRGNHERDSRLTLISLTKQGRDILDQVRPYTQKSEKLLLKGIDEKELKALLDILEENVSTMLDTLGKSRTNRVDFNILFDESE